MDSSMRRHYGPKITQRMKLLSLLDELGVKYRTSTDEPERRWSISDNEILISADDGDKQGGYSGFFVMVEFDEAGNLTKFGIGE